MADAFHLAIVRLPRVRRTDTNKACLRTRAGSLSMRTPNPLKDILIGYLFSHHLQLKDRPLIDINPTDGAVPDDKQTSRR